MLISSVYYTLLIFFLKLLSASQYTVLSTSKFRSPFPRVLSKIWYTRFVSYSRTSQIQCATQTLQLSSDELSQWGLADWRDTVTLPDTLWKRPAEVWQKLIQNEHRPVTLWSGLLYTANSTQVVLGFLCLQVNEEKLGKFHVANACSHASLPVEMYQN